MHPQSGISMGTSWHQCSISPPTVDTVSGNITKYISADMLPGHLQHFDFALNSTFFSSRELSVALKELPASLSFQAWAPTPQATQASVHTAPLNLFTFPPLS